MQLRDYQADIVRQVATATTHDCIQLDTGAGKTAIMAALAKDRPSICVAHRNVLIEQIALALAQFGLPHGIIGAKHTVARCALRQRQVLGHDLVDMRNQHNIVASLDSLLSWHKRGRLMLDTSAPWLLHIDEAHHCADGNKWARLREIFPNARFVGYTATPCRLDGASLHTSDGGLFDRLVQAEGLRDNSCATLIARGFLSDFVAYGTRCDLEFEKLVKKNNHGDYTVKSVEDAVLSCAILGDALKHYKKLAKGRQAVAFTVSIKTAQILVENYREGGVNADYIASSRSASLNATVMEAFRRREINVLVSVDMIGEGFDVPGIECIQMLRPTGSFGLHRQMIGRALRPCDGKDRAIIIDHVRNISVHGMPDAPVQWRIERPPKEQKTNLVSCEQCFHFFYAWLRKCPECGAINELTSRGQSPVHDAIVIDWNLVQLKRDEIDKSAAIAEQERRMRSEYLPPKWDYGHDLMGRALNKISQWYCQALADAGLLLVEVNQFSQGKPPPPSFWMAHFTVKDVGDTEKAVAVYLNQKNIGAKND